jgi:hypothetical protein
MSGQVKRIDFSLPYIEACGVKYHVKKTLSVDRWRQFEDLQAKVGFGKSFQELFDSVRKAYEKLQEPKIADASVILHNIMLGVKDKLDKRHDPALQICALFINGEDEDEKVYDEEVMNKKIENWRKEGYAIQDFFTMAWNLVPGCIEIYEEDLKNTLNQVKKKSKVSKSTK